MMDEKQPIRLRTLSWYVTRDVYLPRAEPFCAWWSVRIEGRLTGVKVRAGNRRLGLFWM